MVVSCLGFLISCMIITTCSAEFSPNDHLPASSFNESFFKLYGDNNVVFLDDEGNSVQISLDQTSGSGFISQDAYLHAYFSASIKLPPDYTAGVVVTFYASNGGYGQYTNNHDEIDFEFLGNIRGRPWLVQTNIYGNGSINRGREERYRLWFNPTEDFHTYGILWSSKCIVFYVDGVAVRETRKVDAMGGDFPSKPMSLFSTIWDGSSWATSGGKYKTLYKYAPFMAKYSNFVLYGCSIDPTQDPANCNYDNGATDVTSFNGLKDVEKIRMKNFRKKYMIYSYCQDRYRYPTPLPEC